MKTITSTLLCLLFLVGCSGTMSEEDYQKAFRSEAQKFFAFAKSLRSKPLPDRTGLTQDQRRMALAKRMRDDSEGYEKLGNDFRKLKAPPSYKNLHRAYQEFLDGQLRLNNDFADAIEKNDVSGARQKNKEMVDFLGSQMLSVLKETEKLGPNLKPLKDDLTKLMKEAM